MTRTTQDDPRKSIPAPAGHVRFLLKRFGTTDALRAALVKGTDIDEVRLQRPGAEVTLFTFVTLSENLTRVIGESWPLDAMGAWSTAMQGALEVAVRSASTIGDSMDVVCRYGHVRGPFLDLKTRRARNRLQLVVAPAIQIEAVAWRALSVTSMLGVTGMLVPMLEGRSDQIEVDFPWPSPPYVERLRNAFASKIIFGGRDFTLSVPATLLNEASPFADANLHASAVGQLEQASKRILDANRLILRLQEMLKRKRRGRMSEAEAAQELGLSRRTLVRRLSESGTSFRAMLDADLKARARMMIDAGSLSRSDLAEVLGFEDPTSFSRACRRWFG